MPFNLLSACQILYLIHFTFWTIGKVSEHFYSSQYFLNVYWWLLYFSLGISSQESSLLFLNCSLNLIYLSLANQTLTLLSNEHIGALCEEAMYILLCFVLCMCMVFSTKNSENVSWKNLYFEHFCFHRIEKIDFSVAKNKFEQNSSKFFFPLRYYEVTLCGQGTANKDI